jgi:hypothetical protein
MTSVATTDALSSQILLERLGAHFDPLGLVGPEEGLALLTNLATAQRWRPALDNMEHTYRLSALMLQATFYNNAACEERIVTLINDWVAPHPRFETYPSMRALADAFFGAAWYSLVVEAQGISRWDVAMMVLSERPLFLDGLAPKQGQVAAHALPSLEVTP